MVHKEARRSEAPGQVRGGSREVQGEFAQVWAVLPVARRVDWKGLSEGFYRLLRLAPTALREHVLCPQTCLETRFARAPRKFERR